MCLITIICRQVNFFWHVPVADESQTRLTDGTIMCYFDCLFSISAPWWMFPALSWRVFGPNVLKCGGAHGQSVPPVILRFEVKREGERQRRCGGELVRLIDAQLHCSAAQLWSVIHHSPFAKTCLTWLKPVFFFKSEILEWTNLLIATWYILDFSKEHFCPNKSKRALNCCHCLHTNNPQCAHLKA